jgi:phosphonate transport system ATP-binding protein
MSKIGYIPQSLGLVKNITVLENVLIGSLPRIGKLNSLLKKFPESEIQEAEKIIKLVGLGGKSERKAYMLSGGEKRRVAIARALMQKPILLLADEIVSELDQVTAREIMDLVADAQQRLNLTAVMVHHDMQLALEYANRVAVIKEGRKILEIGIEGDKIIDFQSGNISQQEIMELYNSNEP